MWIGKPTQSRARNDWRLTEVYYNLRNSIVKIEVIQSKISLNFFWCYILHPRYESKEKLSVNHMHIFMPGMKSSMLFWVLTVNYVFLLYIHTVSLKISTTLFNSENVTFKIGSNLHSRSLVPHIMSMMLFITYIFHFGEAGLGIRC